METVITNELFKSASKLQTSTGNFSVSYIEAMKSALNFFKEHGIPSKKDEDWKYTNIAKNLSPRVYDSSELIEGQLPSQIIDKNSVIVFNNGKFNQTLSQSFQAELNSVVLILRLIILTALMLSISQLLLGQLHLLLKRIQY